MRRSTLEKFDLTPSYFDNRYEVFSTVGRGRGSVVYRARRSTPDKTLDLTTPPIALKVLLGIERDPAAAIRRIKREALALLTCKSSSVIRILDYVAREDTCYITMEYAKYSDLRKLFEKGDTNLSPRAILKLVQGILQGVASIHEVGILHRDLKLENFLLTEDYQVKVADFSVCLLKGERADIHLVNEVVGTFDYAAPECLNGGRYSKASDLYSIGVSAFEMLTGNLPTVGLTLKEVLLDKSRGRIRELPSNILSQHASLEYFFIKALNPDPDSRFESAKEMSFALEEVLQGTFKKVIKGKKQNRVRIFNTTPVGYLKNHYEYGVDTFENVLDRFRGNAERSFRFVALSIVYTVIFLTIFYLKNSIFEYMSLSSPYSNEKEISSYDVVSSFAGVGVLYDLYSEGRNYNFTLVPAGEGRAYFSLSKEGWSQVLISYDGLGNNDPIEIIGEGINLELYVEESLSNEKIAGTYKNNISGLSGRWEAISVRSEFYLKM
jgi:serine/threonine protein kinase